MFERPAHLYKHGMDRNSKSPLFEQLLRPEYALTSPSAVLSEADYDLVRITLEDFRFVTRPFAREFIEVPADLRARSTILRRLLCHGDLFNIGRLFPPKIPLRVKARMLDFDPAHETMVLSCGNYPWGENHLEGLGLRFDIRGVAPMIGTPWSYRKNADVSLGPSIGIQPGMQVWKDRDRQLHGRAIRQLCEFEVGHGEFLGAPRREDEIAMNDETNGRARTNRDRRLHLQILRGELIAGARDVLLGRLPYRLYEVAFSGEGQARSDAKQRRQGDTLEQRPSVEIDFVGEPRIACGIGRRNIIDLQRTAVRQDDPLPDDERPALAKGDDAIVCPDQSRTLRDQLDTPVAVSKIRSVIWAVTKPGKSERSPVMRLAEITLPADSV